MTDHKQILEMIENVTSPVKQVKLLCEIDCAVRSYLNEGDDYNTVYRTHTRSRDALKSIRPDGWEPCLHQHDKESYTFILDKALSRTRTKHLMSECLPTEELSELHAIIQAIAWERSQ